VQTDIDSDRTLVTDQAGKQRISKTNALGQLKDIWEVTASDQWTEAISFPNQTLSAGYRTSYSYDTLNNLTTVNQGVQTRSFSYSSLSRLLTAANPESGTINYGYDPNGNLTQKTDARGVQTAYVYDALNRVTQRNYSAPADLPNYQTTPNVVYTYDAVNVAFSKGKLTKVANGFSTTEYTEFDILGRVKKNKQTTDNTAYNEMLYSYNLRGALIEQTYPSGRVVKNTLDADGDLQQVQSRKLNGTFQNYANAFTYTAAGVVSSMRLGNGKFENTSFNSRLQPTQIGLGSSATNQNLLKLNFDYGTTANNGNVQSQTITVPNVGANPGFTATQTYSYDSLNRLKDAIENITGQTPPSWKQTFTFDRYGNRRFDFTNGNTTVPASSCTEAICNPTIDPTTNRLIGYGFDPSGNTTQDAQLRKFTYDAENKQTKVETVNSGGTVTGTIGEYSYDGDGRRVKKIAGDEVTIFVYDAASKLVAEYSTIVALTEDAKVAYLTNDHLGSPRINTDANGAVTARHDYHPFGEEIATSQRTNGLNYTADTIRKQFTGYERDGETNLDFAQARYFDSGFGRFSSPDPLMLSAKLENPQTWNRYSYALNAPGSVLDEEGLFPSPAFNCSDKVTACLNDEQRRILNTSKVKVGKEILSGEALYNKLTEKQQNAFVNLTDKLASLKTSDGSTFLSQVRHVKEIRNDRIIAGVRTALAGELATSEQFSEVTAKDHKPFDAISYKSNDTTLGNVQISLNASKAGADIDMDIGNIKSGDVAGPVVHTVEVMIHKLFGVQTNQDTIRRILLADPKVQTITPSPDPKFNRRQK
jgi:RHS repeat-associated protein